MKRHLLLDKTKLLAFPGALIILTILSLVSYGQSETRSYYAHLNAEHAKIVKNYIGSQTNLRPAQASDCKNKIGLDSFHQSMGAQAHPFYAVKDFNRDGIPDLAVVIYEMNKEVDKRFTLLIFNNSRSGDYKLSYKKENIDLRQGGIWLSEFGADDVKTSLTAGVFETDDCFWVEWIGKKYVEHTYEEAEN